MEYSKRRYQENPVLQLEYNKKRYLENPEIQREYQNKEVSWKEKKMWQGWEFPSASKAGTLLYLHYMSSKPVSMQC